MMRSIVIVIAILSTATSAESLDIESLWEPGNPAVSEQRFRTALESAVGDDALILQTQIARTYVFRRDFGQARKILRAVEPDLAVAGPEARVRFWLELGRTYASHQHTPESRTAESRELAREAYTKALEIAQDAHLDGLAVDALHMFAFVDTDPADQVRLGERALAMIESSDQPEAKQWEASIRNNSGEALYELGRYEEALGEFQKALVLREQESNRQAIRDTHWHMARILRALNRIDEALAIQLRLEREGDAADDPRSYIFEELEILFRLNGDTEQAQHYADRRDSMLR